MIERSALYHKHQTAIISNDERYTFEEVHLLSNALQNAFRNLGVEKSSRVGILLPNIPEYIITDFSLIKGGLVRVPLNTKLAAPEIEYILTDSEASVLVYHHDFSSKVDQIRPSLKHIKHFICVGGHEKTIDISFEKLLKESSDEANYESVENEDPFQILYTSGTTGKPKGALTNVRSRISSLNNVFIDEMSITNRDSIIHVASLAHGTGTKVLPHYLKGATNILLQRFDVEEFLETVEKYRATTTWMVPTMISMLIEYPRIEEYDLSSLKTIVYAGASMPVAVIQKAMEVFGNIFVQVYGLSEAPNPDLVLTKEDHLRGLYERPQILDSSGRQILNVFVDIVDEHGNPVKDHEIGEIVIKGDNIMTEYWKNPEATAETIKDGWLYTGDLAKRDEEGYIYIVDRSKDMIISGGYNIYPREIEEVLYQHEAVLEVAVIGVPDERWGEIVKACVVLREGYELTKEELIAYCEEHLARYKKPREVEFLDSLPKNPNGKISKKELRERYSIKN